MWCLECNMEVLFGMPTLKYMILAEKGEILLGGCVVEEENYCPECGNRLVEKRGRRSRKKDESASEKVIGKIDY